MTFLLQSVHMALVLELTQREVQCAWVSKCPLHSLPQQPENIIGSEEDPLVKDRHFINLSFHQFFIKVLWPGDQEACGSDFGTTWFKLPVCSQTLSRYCSEQKNKNKKSSGIPSCSSSAEKHISIHSAWTVRKSFSLKFPCCFTRIVSVLFRISICWMNSETRRLPEKQHIQKDIKGEDRFTQRFGGIYREIDEYTFLCYILQVWTWVLLRWFCE